MSDTHSAVARTPLHSWHQARGAHFVDRDGWQVVAAYSSANPEAAAAHAGLGIADISAFAKFSLRGAGVPSLAAALAGMLRKCSVYLRRESSCQPPWKKPWPDLLTCWWISRRQVR